ncbi:MAG: hypothetical protein ACPGVU_11625 [Limisphaerales bacterium]
MKVSSKHSQRRGISLVQCLVYIAGLIVIGNVAVKSLFAVINGTNRNRAVAQDIVTAMNTGEQWRKDIRSAVGPVIVKETIIEIPQTEGKIIYEFKDATIARRLADGSREMILQTDVVASQLVKEARGDLTVWRWELELKPNGRGASMRPLFSFLAVQPQGS